MCVCVCVCVCVYVYVCVYVENVFVNLCMDVNAYIRLYECVHGYMSQGDSWVHKYASEA